MSDNETTLPQKVIHLQGQLMMQQEGRFTMLCCRDNYLKKCFLRSKKVYKETLEETKITMQWSVFLRKLYKLILNYSELQFCTVSLCFLCSNFKIIKEICERNKER